MSIPRILIIAGSDSGGGAGIQADIKTVTMLGGHAMTAITAITAQNTLGVYSVSLVPADLVTSQIEYVLGDLGVDAVKIGMIGSVATANAVADLLGMMPAGSFPIVFDPVMVSTSGALLADDRTIETFERLMRIATVATPNLPELETLADSGRIDSTNIESVTQALADRTGCSILAKGGHIDSDTITDRLVGPGEAARSWTDPRVLTRHTHGTGCTLSTAIAVGLARGLTTEDAVSQARLFVRLALREAPGFGGGNGPMGHAKVRLDCGRGAVLNQVTVPLSDYAASVEFYRRLGLRQIVDSPPRYARFEAPGGATLSIHADPGVQPGPTTIYFECDDLDARVTALEAQGVVFDEQPADRDWLWREARLRDPFGNRICLYRAGENWRFPPWRIDQGVA